MSDSRHFYEPRQIRAMDLQEDDVMMVRGVWRYVYSVWHNRHREPALSEDWDSTPEEIALVNRYLTAPDSYVLVFYREEAPDTAETPIVTIPLRCYDLVTVQAPTGPTAP